MQMKAGSRDRIIHQYSIMDNSLVCPMVGKTVSHKQTLEHLGGGGMTIVYKAQDLKLDRSVA